MAKLELNQSPILTTRNYGINNAKVDDSIFCTRFSVFKNVKIENDCGFLKKNAKKVAFFNKIGEPFDEQLEKKSNVNLLFEIDKSEQKPLQISFDFDDKNCALVQQLMVVVKDGMQAKLVINLCGKTKAYHNGLIKVDCEENSKVDVLLVSDFEKESTNILRIENCVEKNAELNFTIIDFANGTTIENYYSKLCGDVSQSNLRTLYIAGGESFVDLNFLQDVFGKAAKASIETVGALFGSATKHFKGTINFEKGCKKSRGSEDELCLLLSKNAKSKALPMLLCTEEDVDGKHSSSVGKVGERELFYIMSRGFSKAEALKLFVKAKFNSILDKLFDEEIKQKLIEIIDRKLSYEQSI